MKDSGINQLRRTYVKILNLFDPCIHTKVQQLPDGDSPR